MPPSVNDELTKDTIKEDVKTTKQMASPFAELDANAVDINITEANNEDVHNNKSSKIDQNMEIDSRNQNDNENRANNVEEDDDFKLVLEDTIIDDKNERLSDKSTPPKCEKPPTIISARTPRRVQLITLSSPKSAKKVSREE